MSDDALKGRDILCFSNDWSGDPLSKTHIMRLLARDNRVLWINSVGYRRPQANRSDALRALTKVMSAMQPVREVEPNLFVLSPLIVPIHDQRSVRSLNRTLLGAQVRHALGRLRFRRPIHYTFLPSAGLVAGDFCEDMIIYHCVDEFAAFSGVDAASLAEQEDRLVRRADLVIVSAARLLPKRAELNPHTVLVRHGVNFEHFRTALDHETLVPDDIAGLPRPILGYFGLIAEDWVDIDLLVRVAQHYRGGSLVMLGKATMDTSALARLPNVHLLGRKPYSSLPAYCKGFDVALIPFPINDVTLGSNPLKAREYLASGLPTVSTAIPEVEVLGRCRVAADHGAFLHEVEAALRVPGPDRDRSESMRSEGWEARVEEIRRHVSALDPYRRRAATPGPGRVDPADGRPGGA